MINLYWWEPKESSNYGDSLSPWIVGRVFKQHIRKSPIEKADMVAIGSILPFLPRDFAGIIWGSGTMALGLPPLYRAKIRLLRGPISQQALRAPMPSMACTALGDPALLLPHFFSGPGKRFKLGIMPHHTRQSMRAAFEVYQALNSTDTVFIDPLAPLEVVLLQITTCEAIISQSLHGIITADAYGIPNLKVDFVGGRYAADLKFEDYYQSVDRKFRKDDIKAEGANLDSLLSLVGEERAIRANVRFRQLQILDSVRLV